MIESLYIDNYKCFVDFEWKIDQLQLVVGDNGTGKSTALRVIDGLRQLICEGEAAEGCFEFSPHDWSDFRETVFELSLQTHSGVFRYRVSLDRVDSTFQLKQESLSLNDRELMRATTPYTQLFTESKGEIRFPSNAKGSVIATIPAGYPGTEPLLAFRDALSHTLVLAPAPRQFEWYSNETIERPDRDLRQLASWLRHIEKTSPEAWTHMQADLREILPGFDELRFVVPNFATTSPFLVATFSSLASSGQRKFSLVVDELSDGQKNLIALYAVLHTASANGDSVFIDEPTNYVAIREIQPWLTAMSDRVHETGAQCVLVSHHPEIVDYLAADYGVVFYRDDNDAVRVKRISLEADETLTPAQLMARGWGP